VLVSPKFITEFNINKHVRSNVLGVQNVERHLSNPQKDFFVSTKASKKTDFSLQRFASEVVTGNSNVVKTIGKIDINFSPIEVSNEAKKDFLNYFLGADSRLAKSIKTADINSFGRKGLPLKYPRKKFISDLSRITKTLKEEDKDDLFKLVGISVNLNKSGNIISYDGIPSVKNLDLTTSLHQQISKHVRLFTEHNEVISKDCLLNDSMNILLKAVPEYINIIGKQQHHTQKFSLECHILRVLKSTMANNNYAMLPAEDKPAAILMVLFHDISKKEGVVDKSHPAHSAIYLKNIFSKFNFSEQFNDRVGNLVRNHHWLEYYNKKIAKPEDIAECFSHNKKDYDIAKIFAEADLKGVCPELYEKFGNALSHEMQAPIEKALANMNAKKH